MFAAAVADWGGSMGALVAGTCLVLWMEGLCCLCPSLGTDAETDHVLPSAVAVAVVIGHSCLLTPTSLLAEMLAAVPLVRNLFLIFGSTPGCRSGSSAWCEHVLNSDWLKPTCWARYSCARAFAFHNASA